MSNVRSNSAGRTAADHLLLLGRFLRSPRSVGTIAPSSRVLARAMIDGLDLTGAVRVVGLGPGTGAFHHEIFTRLGAGARYLGVEIEPAFVAGIRAQWPAADCVCGSAEVLPALLAERGVAHADSIISGLPFASLPAATTRAVLTAIQRSLRPGGTFTTFQYVHGFRFSLAVAFRRQMSELLGSACTARLVMRNLPPAYVLRWQIRP